MRVQDLRQHIRSGNIDPCYILTGDDEFLVRNAESSFESIVKGSEDFSLRILTAPKPQEVVESALTISFFGCSVVLVREFSAKDIKPVLDYLAKPNPATVLVFSCPDEDFIKKTENKATVVLCDKLTQDMIDKWILREFSRAGRTITKDALKLFVDNCGGKMNRISMEINKLLYSDSAEIGVGHISEFVTKTLEFKIYELAEAIARRNADKAMEIYDTLVYSVSDIKNPYTSILSGLYSHYRRLLYSKITPLREEDVARELGVKPFAVKMAREQAAGYSSSKLLEILRKIGDSEYAFKSGRMSQENACESAVLGILAL